MGSRARSTTPPPRVRGLEALLLLMVVLLLALPLLLQPVVGGRVDATTVRVYLALDSIRFDSIPFLIQQILYVPPSCLVVVLLPDGGHAAEGDGQDA